MKVVLDCNVVVAAVWNHGTCAQLLVTAVRHHAVILSPPILDEYRRIALRPKHARHRQALRTVINELEAVAALVLPSKTVFGLDDPDDEVYLATAEAAGAILVTGNANDFRRPRYGTVAVYSPRAFLDRFGAAHS